MDDKELFEQLARGPLARNGFDESLRRKINERLDNPKRRINRFWFLRWNRASMALLLLIVVVVGLWSWRNFDMTGSRNQKSAIDKASMQTKPASDLGNGNVKPHSAVVIGLREDVPGSPSSTYRTILVAPQENQLAVIGSGPGIWMPYKTKFWKIDAVPDPLGKGLQTLEASPADSKTQDSIPVEKSNPLRRTEKLLYAGHIFVSILQTTNVNQEGVAVDQSQAWVSEVANLNPSVRVKSINALEDGHLPLAKALVTGPATVDIDQWAIARDSAAWVVKKQIGSSIVASASEIGDWPTVSAQLSTDVVRDDPLALSWEDIKSLVPTATDAFTSQAKDVVAIVSPGSIELYPYRIAKADMKPLSVSIHSNESVVMVQWATEQKYIDNWIRMLSPWFSTPANPS
jgi:hypothetical protein